MFSAILGSAMRAGITVKGINHYARLMEQAVVNDIQRGNYARFLDQKLKVTAIGDKHFFSFARVPWVFYLMGPASTETDVYGERGFPPNNTGVVFFGAS